MRRVPRNEQRIGDVAVDGDTELKDLKLNSIMGVREVGSPTPPHNLIATSSASIVDSAVSVCVLAPKLMGPPSAQEEECA